jgi:hypothetical protein
VECVHYAVIAKGLLRWAMLTIMLCREFGPPLIRLFVKTRVVHAIVVTSYLLLFSLGIIFVATVIYDKYG